MSKPHKYIRKARGYCCQRCDGPYSSWKRKTKRSQKKRDNTLAKKDMKREIDE